jgi:hypothetical protein
VTERRSCAPARALRVVHMASASIQDVWFDDTATMAMGEAFDHACVSLHRFGRSVTARELIAKRIINAAKKGERSPDRLYRQALKAIRIEDMSMLVIGPRSPLPSLCFGHAR